MFCSIQVSGFSLPQTKSLLFLTDRRTELEVDGWTGGCIWFIIIKKDLNQTSKLLTPHQQLKLASSIMWPDLAEVKGFHSLGGAQSRATAPQHKS